LYNFVLIKYRIVLFRLNTALFLRANYSQCKLPISVTCKFYWNLINDVQKKYSYREKKRHCLPVMSLR